MKKTLFPNFPGSSFKPRRSFKLIKLASFIRSSLLCASLSHTSSSASFQIVQRKLNRLSMSKPPPSMCDFIVFCGEKSLPLSVDSTSAADVLILTRRRRILKDTSDWQILKAHEDLRVL